MLQLWPLAAGAAYRLNQLRYWGIHPSFAFVEEPETNGVVERWNRTLKEQAVYGRVFRNLADVRAAVAEFVERYNQCWRLKLAYRTPSEEREEYELRHAGVAQTGVQETGCGTRWRHLPVEAPRVTHSGLGSDLGNEA